MQYLAAVVIDQGPGEAADHAMIHYVAPVGEKKNAVERVFSAIRTGDRQPVAQL
ncbi:hypothetical protein AB0H00_25240 [Nocardia sp. NPDC023852]|uniref:hypothetical protein n=1 Tax=Nocardia sp. NPDC023852 TaxID=3154697 RepID=UPI003403E766